MLTIRTDKGRVVPWITCCHCGEPIRNAIEGIVVVAADGTARIVHKSGGDFFCDRRPPGSTWLPLEVLLLDLRQNCQFNAPQAEAAKSLWQTMP
ncbi:MAG: hypothetical protein ACREJ2_08415 [Planctomycetota bacterium]